MSKKVHFYVPEFIENIKTQDIIKGIVILEHLQEMDDPTRKEVLRLLNEADESYALLLLSEFLNMHSDALEKDKDLKELLFSKLEEKPVIANWLPPEVASSLLIEVLNETSSEPRLVDIIISLGEIGSEESVGNLTDLLYSGSFVLTKAAVEALGKIANHSAIEALVKRLGDDEICDLLILDALAESQTTMAYKVLCDYLGSHHAGSRNKAKSLLFKMGKPALPFLYENLKKDNADLLVHTFNVLGLIADPGSGKPIRQFLFHAPADANIRFAAFEALGSFKLAGGSFILASGLEDEDEGVRTAVAKAIDRNLDPILDQGIRNMLRTEDDKAAELVHLFLNSEAEHVFAKMLDHSFFKNTAAQYLRTNAHEDIRKKFLNILNQKGESELAQFVSQGYLEETPEKASIWAIDDSRMILRMYRMYLHGLGYEPIMFEFPEQALERIKTEKPLMVFTDLNMPKFTGIDVAKAIRQTYSKHDLPIVMVTTQSDQEDHTEAMEAGVTEVIMKPFTKETIQSCLEKYL